MCKHEQCFLIELLYLYTVRKDTQVEHSRESHRALKAALDSIVPAYDDLIDRLSNLIESSEAKNSPARVHFSDDLRCLISSRAHTEKIRRKAAASGSKKTDPREWYLYMMAGLVEGATRGEQIPALVDLIDAASAAHGQETGSLNNEMLEKRIRRCRVRFAWAGGRTYRLPPVERRRVDPLEYLDPQEYLDIQKSLEAQSQFDAQPHIEDEDIPF